MMREKRFLRKPGSVNFRIEKHRKLSHFFAITREGLDQSFSSSSLDRDIDETILCAKFHHNRITLSRVIVYTAGHTDRFYSVLTF